MPCVRDATNREVGRREYTVDLPAYQARSIGQSITVSSPARFAAAVDRAEERKIELLLANGHNAVRRRTQRETDRPRTHPGRPDWGAELLGLAQRIPKLELDLPRGHPAPASP